MPWKHLAWLHLNVTKYQLNDLPTLSCFVRIVDFKRMIFMDEKKRHVG